MQLACGQLAAEQLEACGLAIDDKFIRKTAECSAFAARRECLITDLDSELAQVLQQQWAAAGIKVNIKPMETAPLIGLWLKGDFGLLSIALSWSPDPDAIVSRLLSTGSQGKGIGMADAPLDKLIEDARAILDNTKRAAAYQQIQKHIADQAYILQIYQYPLRWEAWRKYVKGYVPLAANIRTFVRTTWVDK